MSDRERCGHVLPVVGCVRCDSALPPAREPRERACARQDRLARIEKTLGALREALTDE